jgi:GNAT superfamily N-acetyltransferase
MIRVERIRPATLDDVDVLVAFAIELARENVAEELDPARVRRGIVEILTRPELNCTFFLALVAGEPCGQLLLTREFDERECGCHYWARRIFVKPAWRRNGIARLLIKHEQSYAMDAGDAVAFDAIVVKGRPASQSLFTGLGWSRLGTVFIDRRPESTRNLGRASERRGDEFTKPSWDSDGNRLQAVRDSAGR